MQIFMTNIAAFKIYEGKDKPEDTIVMIADSQTTAGDMERKYDSAQKLFDINGSLLMSSGYREPALEILKELKGSSIKGVKPIAQGILDISTRKKLTARMPLDFIVAGIEEGKAQLYCVNATGFDPYFPDKSSSENKFMEERFYALGGSGSGFASRVLSGQIDVGIDPKPRDITSGLSLMKAIAEAATESLGVNDKLQYGVVTPVGNKRLFHPSINLETEEDWKRYFEQLLSKSPRPYTEPRSLENLAVRDANYPLELIGSDFYHAFNRSLEELNRQARVYRGVCDLHLRDEAFLNNIKEQCEKYKLAKENADIAVQTLLSGSAEDFVAYIKADRAMREICYDRILS
jgi:hypothetical protein